jgi:ferredoxin-thioredoxin reductase catalytic subunit
LTTFEAVHTRAQINARAHGYYLNYKPIFLKDLLEGLKTNEERYGYPSCPCRIAAGYFELDRDIICPCEYRDQDIQEYGACFCSLYISKQVYEEETELHSIPERRPVEKQFRMFDLESEEKNHLSAHPVERTQTHRELLYCKQCGYVTFREQPPYLCPICKAPKERFANIGTTINFLSS